MSDSKDNANIKQTFDYRTRTPEEYMNRVYHANTTINHYHVPNPPPYNQTPHHHQNVPRHVLPSNIPGLPSNYPFHPQTSISVPPYSSSQQHQLQQVRHPTTTPIVNTSPASASSLKIIENKDAQRKLRNKRRNTLRKAKRAKKSSISIPLLQEMPHPTTTPILNTSPASAPSLSKESIEKKDVQQKHRNKRRNVMKKLKKAKD